MIGLSHTGKRAQLLYRLRGELASGLHGTVGTAFMTVRDLAENSEVSLVTAHRVLSELKQLGVLQRSGKRLIISHRESVFNPHSLKIGVLLTNVNNPFFSRLLNALELAGRQRAVTILASGSNYDLGHEKTQLEMLSECGVNGFLICPAHDIKSASTLEKLDKPYVLIGHCVDRLKSNVVMVQNFEAGRKVAKHLLRLGCQDFIYVGIDSFSADERRQGFIYELQESGYHLPQERIVSQSQNGQEIEPKWLHKFFRGQRTGVFCYHDLLALRVIRCARYCDFRVPQDFSIVGFDDLPLAGEMFPSLSSVAYPLTHIADNALNILLNQINQPGKEAGVICSLETKLVARESSVDF